MELIAREAGPRDALAAILDERAEGERHRGKDALAEDARAAAQSIREGATSVRVGRIEYLVTAE